MNSTLLDTRTLIGVFDRSNLCHRYELEEEIGRGGMGVVFRGKHRELRQIVAIKFQSVGLDVDRFRNEAQLMAQINSPSIGRVYDFEILPDGQAMMVMSWITGKDLESIPKPLYEIAD